jgi:transaldolase
VDHNKAQDLCFEAQMYYRANGINTQVLPASLTSIDEVMALAGVDHITISPPLLKELTTKPAAEWSGASLFDRKAEAAGVGKQWPKYVGDESGWRIAFTRSGKGEGERKLSQVSEIETCGGIIKMLISWPGRRLISFAAFRTSLRR